jgi:tRNA threonylcarbamoyladenosine biosynthesis protein TsaB
MRVLALESSTRRGSVALVEDGRVVARACHEEPSAHAERLLGLVEEVLSCAGWERETIERVAAGTGPGSFTGLRAGVALAQGIALGLGVPIVGVSSLAALADIVPRTLGGVRFAFVDAMRGEVFVAAYDVEGSCVLPARALAPEQVREVLTAQLTEWSSDAAFLVGEALSLVPALTELPVVRFDEAALPDASGVGRLGERMSPGANPVSPEYAREADAARPKLAPDALVAEVDRQEVEPAMHGGSLVDASPAAKVTVPARRGS